MYNKSTCCILSGVHYNASMLLSTSQVEW